MAFNMVRFPDILAQTIGQAVGVEVRKLAKANVRKDSEDLEGSIRVDRLPDGSREVSANTEYAAVQEYGHPYYPSREAPPSVPKSGPGGPYTYNPYMRPAAKETRDNMSDIVRKYTPAAVRKAGG
jgi:hypothetical protein